METSSSSTLSTWISSKQATFVLVFRILQCAATLATLLLAASGLGDSRHFKESHSFVSVVFLGVLGFACTSSWMIFVYVIKKERPLPIYSGLFEAFFAISFLIAGLIATYSPMHNACAGSAFSAVFSSKYNGSCKELNASLATTFLCSFLYTCSLCLSIKEHNDYVRRVFHPILDIGNGGNDIHLYSSDTTATVVTPQMTTKGGMPVAKATLMMANSSSSSSSTSSSSSNNGGRNFPVPIRNYRLATIQRAAETFDTPQSDESYILIPVDSHHTELTTTGDDNVDAVTTYHHEMRTPGPKKAKNETETAASVVGGRASDERRSQKKTKRSNDDVAAAAAAKEETDAKKTTSFIIRRSA